MNIIDQRKKNNHPAVQILNDIFVHLNKDYLIGIRSIILCDQSLNTKYHQKKGEEVFGSYSSIKGTNQADIYLYFSFLDLALEDAPSEVKKSKFFLTAPMLHTLLHELYHHRIRGQRLCKRPKQKVEEKEADKWANKKLVSLMNKMYGEDYIKQEVARLKEIAKNN